MWRYRNAAHYMAGIITALSSTVSWVLPVVCFAAFTVYELNEDWHIKDKAYYDMLEFMIGFYVACAGLIGKEFLP